jgi:SAM-dependent methyltransferase
MSDHLSKEVKAVINPPFWDSYRYVSVRLRKVYEKLIPSLLENSNKVDVLDYGCGVKPYYYLFGNQINKYIGVDVGSNPFADDLIQPGAALNYADNSFDIVLSSQVLEHVEDVNQYMSEIKRVLRPGGIVLLSTHGTWQYHASPYDYQRWTSMGLKTLMKKYGFEVKNFVPILGQLAVTSQLRLSFFDSFANMIGIAGRIIIAPLAIIYQLKMRIEDKITPQRVKERDSAYYVISAINKK